MKALTQASFFFYPRVKNIPYIRNNRRIIFMKKLVVSVVAVIALLGVCNLGCTEEVKTGEEAYVYISDKAESKPKKVAYRKVDTGNSITFIKDEDNGNLSKEFVSEYVSNSGADYDEADDIIIIKKK